MGRTDVAGNATVVVLTFFVRCDHSVSYWILGHLEGSRLWGICCVCVYLVLRPLFFMLDYPPPLIWSLHSSFLSNGRLRRWGNRRPQGLGRNSCWRKVRRDGWPRLVEFVCRVERREHLSGLPGLYCFNSADGKHEVHSAPWVSSVPGQWANGREAIANPTSRHDLSASVTITLSWKT